MNCEVACQLIDDYLENRLGRVERQRLEAHLGSCRECAEELNTRPRFERTMWRGLAASVQHLTLAPDASQRIVRAAQAARRRGIWSHRASRTVQVMAAFAAVAVVLFGILFVLSPSQSRRALDLFGLQADSRAAPQADTPMAVSLSIDSLYIEPWDMEPSDPFTITVILESNLPQPIDSLGLDLGFSGPTGFYGFALAAKGPFPTQGVSVLQLPSQFLAVSCAKKYQIAPTDIFRVPGVYTVHAALSSVTKPER